MVNKKNKTLTYILLTLGGLIMIYPLVWLFMSSFKSNNEIFGQLKLIPDNFIWDSYAKAWQKGQYPFTVFLLNSFKLVLPVVLFTVMSCSIVAYGFARFTFPMKKIFFTVMLSTLMLPNAVVIVPRYILFRNFGWINSYLPFIVPALFASSSFFIFMLVQFFRGVPRELDESATIDGCNSFTVFTRIILPLSKPALLSVVIFQFIWVWNDYFDPLIYINSVSKFTVQLALRMSIDIMESVNWNQVMALSVVTLMPPTLIFFFAQKYFVEGIVTTGLKG